MLVEKETVLVIKSGNLNKFVQSHYGQKFEFEADQETKSGWHLFNIFRGKLREFESRRLEQFKKGERVDLITSVLLLDLCNQGIIEPGTYLIEVQ